MFKAEAPEECIAAGLDGSGRRDWDECHKLTEDKGDKKEDCAPDELHICEDGYCKCTSDPNEGCGAVDCEQGYECQYGKCFPVGGGCGDCEAKCPGASRTDCVNDKCECYYEDKGKGSEPEACKRCAEECGPERSWDCKDGICECGKFNECYDGCEKYCAPGEHTDCRDNKCVCLGYGESGPPDSGRDGDDDQPVDDGSDDTGGDQPVDDGTGDGSDSGSDDGTDDSSDDSGSGDDSGSDDSGSDDGGSDSGSDDSGSDLGGEDTGDNTEPTE